MLVAAELDIERVLLGRKGFPEYSLFLLQPLRVPTFISAHYSLRKMLDLC